MKYNGSDLPKPQIEEDITRAEWIDPVNIDNITNNTYSSIKEVISEVLY